MKKICIFPCSENLLKMQTYQTGKSHGPQWHYRETELWREGDLRCILLKNLPVCLLVQAGRNSFRLRLGLQFNSTSRCYRWLPRRVPGTPICLPVLSSELQAAGSLRMRTTDRVPGGGAGGVAQCCSPTLSGPRGPLPGIAHSVASSGRGAWKDLERQSGASPTLQRCSRRPGPRTMAGGHKLTSAGHLPNSGRGSERLTCAAGCTPGSSPPTQGPHSSPPWCVRTLGAGAQTTCRGSHTGARDRTCSPRGGAARRTRGGLLGASSIGGGGERRGDSIWGTNGLPKCSVHTEDASGRPGPQRSSATERPGVRRSRGLEGAVFRDRSLPGNTCSWGACG